MPPRQTEQCSCTFSSGCLIMRQTEHGDGTAFVRFVVIGYGAQAVLEQLLHTELPRFAEQYTPLEPFGLMWRIPRGWPSRSNGAKSGVIPSRFLDSQATSGSGTGCCVILVGTKHLNE
jgi:hypothetical protein